MSNELKLYSSLLNDIKARIRQGQLCANLSVNAEMLAAYWDIGKMIHKRQQEEGWGKAVIPRLAQDLKNELSEIKGFSVRNIQLMIQFYIEYQDIDIIMQPPVAQLGSNTKTPQKTMKEVAMIRNMRENHKCLTI